MSGLIRGIPTGLCLSYLVFASEQHAMPFALLPLGIEAMMILGLALGGLYVLSIHDLRDFLAGYVTAFALCLFLSILTLSIPGLVSSSSATLELALWGALRQSIPIVLYLSFAFLVGSFVTYWLEGSFQR